MLKGALILTAGIAIGWAPQAFERALERHYIEREREMTVELMLASSELRQSSRTLRYQCPSRAQRLQGLIFTPGAPL